MTLWTLLLACVLWASCFSVLIVGQGPEEELFDALEECENDGRFGAYLAASAACKVVLNKCPKAENITEPLAVPKSGGAGGAQGTGQIRERFLGQALETACNGVLMETCASSAFTVAQEREPECFAILQRGPAVPFAEECPDLLTANCWFEMHVSNVCRNSTLDESKCKKKGPAGQGEESDGTESSPPPVKVKDRSSAGDKDKESKKKNNSG